MHLDNFSFLNYKEVSSFKKEFFNSVFVVKYGGAAMKNKILKIQLIDDLIFLSSLGIKIILVHGGGPLINDWLIKCNIKPKFDKGIRITDFNTMEVVEMVLSGQINKELVNLLGQKGIKSIGLSGKDSNLIRASSLFDCPDNLVGKIDSIDNTILNLLLDNHYIPVIASVASDLNNITYNINADTVASAIAVSIKAKKLILLTDTTGIMRNIDDPSTLFKHLTINKIKMLKEDRIISGGMIPKVDCCVDALYGKISATHIIDGRIKHSLLYELLTSARLGSMIVLD